MNPQIKPYIIVPNLIEQPTWGGDYISTLKQISDPTISSMIFGQSYELYEHSNLSSKFSTQHLPSLEMADPVDPTNTQQNIDNDQLININHLIKIDPIQVLGPKPTQKFGNKITTLIKLTQAKGNSFQVHRTLEKKSDDWVPKPESWYYFEPGLATLGLKVGTDWHQYQKTCQLIDNKAQEVSQLIQKNQLSLKTGREQLESLIHRLNPFQYVNLVQIGKNQGVDLSQGGLHHSWEENSQTHPQGNILFEIQQNVYDPDCTIRGFDKGKIKNDGSIRSVHIKDYFKYLNRTPEYNQPEQHFTKGKIIKHTSTLTCKSIFVTDYYTLQELIFSQPISNNLTQTTNSFHHLFVRKGNIKLLSNDHTWIITQGYSIFVPASIGQYSLKPYKSRHVSVIKTFI